MLKMRFVTDVFDIRPFAILPTKCMLPLQYLSDWLFTWRLCLTEIPEEKHGKLNDYLNQI